MPIDALGPDIAPKTYDIEFSEEQEEVLREILEDLEAVEKMTRPPEPEVCEECGQQKQQFMSTWLYKDRARLQGKIHVLQALLEGEGLVINHT